MKKLTWCLLPLVGFIAACGGEGPVANSSAPPAVQNAERSGPNGEQTPLQPSVPPAEEGCVEECADSDDPQCVGNCQCERAAGQDQCSLCLCYADETVCSSVCQ
jgi:hypothetical protein